MPPFYDDDGTEVDPNEIKKPSLCVICKKDSDPDEEILCILTRMDQRFDEEFKCEGFEKI
jgi:hypothetical protein